MRRSILTSSYVQAGAAARSAKRSTLSLLLSAPDRRRRLTLRLAQEATGDVVSPGLCSRLCHSSGGGTDLSGEGRWYWQVWGLHKASMHPNRVTLDKSYRLSKPLLPAVKLPQIYFEE